MPGDCTCDIDRADRGWFKRLHDYCKNKQSEDESENESEYDCPPGSDAYNVIVSIAVVCGLGWVIAGVLSLIACGLEDDTSKTCALVSTSIYFVGYIIFVGLFGVVMTQINYRKSKFDELEYCDNVRKKFRRSGNEFMGYSICGFVFIMVSIICTLVSVPNL